MASYKILRCAADGVAECAGIVKSGGVIVFPTDTVYGIGCDPYNDNSVERIFRIKGRDEGKPLPVLAHSIEDAGKIARLGKTGMILAKRFWPGALTIVAPIADQKLSRRVTAGSSSVAVRVPANDCILSLLQSCRYLVGTSANPSGQKSPKSPQQVIDSGLGGFDALLDGGPVEKGIESTIVDVTDTPFRILREGAVKAGEIQKVLLDG